MSIRRTLLRLIAFAGLGADVITTTAGTVGSAGNVAASLITYLSARLLEVAELRTVLDQFGIKEPLPSNSSKTIRFVRQEKFTVSASPTELTEGVNPDSVGVTMNQFEALTEQYGQLVRLSDLAELTAKHNVVSRTIYTLGLHAAETYDQLIYNVLDGANNNYRPNGKTVDTALVGDDHIAYVDLIELNAILNNAGGRPYDDGDYVFVTSSFPYAAMLKDPDFKAASQLAAPERMWRGQINMLGGFRVVRSNAPGFAATAQTPAGQADKVYSSFALAQYAYHITDLQNLRIYVVPPGGHNDPLQLSRYIGWKFAFKSIITEQSWIRRVRSAGIDSVTN